MNITNYLKFLQNLSIQPYLIINIYLQIYRETFLNARTRLRAHTPTMSDDDFFDMVETEAHRSLLSSAMGKFQNGHYFYLFIE